MQCNGYTFKKQDMTGMLDSGNMSWRWPEVTFTMGRGVSADSKFIFKSRVLSEQNNPSLWLLLLARCTYLKSSERWIIKLLFGFDCEEEKKVSSPLLPDVLKQHTQPQPEFSLDFIPAERGSYTMNPINLSESQSHMNIMSSKINAFAWKRSKCHLPMMCNVRFVFLCICRATRFLVNV